MAPTIAGSSAGLMYTSCDDSGTSVLNTFLPLIKKSYLYPLVALSFSCSTQDSQDVLTLGYDKSESFVLDSTTGFLSFSLQHFLSDTSDLLYIGNHKTNEINVYNRANKELFEKIRLQTEGPDNVGINPWAFYIHASDSIFILSHWEGLLSLIDREGKVSYQKNLADDSWKGYPHPWASTDQPMFYDPKNRILSVPGVVRIPAEGGYSSSHALINLDLEKDTFFYQVAYPKLYDQGYWREDSFNKGYTVKSLGDSIYITSFGIDHYLRLSNGDSVLAKSRYLPDEFKPPAKKYIKGAILENAQQLVYEQGYYSSIVKDPINAVYYRFVGLPVDQDSFDQGQRFFQSSIIILNKDLNFRGEVILEKDVASYIFFLVADGLYMANRAKYEVNEDSLTFDKYVVQNMLPL